MRLVIYSLLGCLIAIVYCRHRASVLPVHAGVILVFIVALAESAVWLAAYQRINLSGEPYCCPFPSHVTAALVLQVLRQTLSRALLLVIALGYSIARPTLTLGEWAGLVSLSLAYCGACKSLISPLFSPYFPLIFGLFSLYFSLVCPDRHNNNKKRPPPPLTLTIQPPTNRGTTNTTTCTTTRCTICSMDQSSITIYTSYIKRKE